MGTNYRPIFKNCLKGHQSLYVYRNNRFSHGGSKTNKGGIKFISRAPVQIPLYYLTLLDRRLNFYHIYDHLLSILPCCERKRLFLQLNLSRTKPHEFFKVFFDHSVKTICIEVAVKGSWINEYMTNHGLCSSMTALLIHAGQTDSSIILSTGHSDRTTLVRYHNLHGV